MKWKDNKFKPKGLNLTKWEFQGENKPDHWGNGEKMINECKIPALTDVSLETKMAPHFPTQCKEGGGERLIPGQWNFKTQGIKRCFTENNRPHILEQEIESHQPSSQM